MGCDPTPVVLTAGCGMFTYFFENKKLQYYVKTRTNSSCHKRRYHPRCHYTTKIITWTLIGKISKNITTCTVTHVYQFTIPILPNSFHLMPLPPYATKPNPITAPTTLCVEETGSFAAVAITSHTAPPDNALNDPRSNSFSVPF